MTSDSSIITTLKAAAAEFGRFTIVVRDIADLDQYKDDPSKPAAACWLDGTLYIDTRFEGGPHFETALAFLATQTAASAAEHLDDDLVLLGIEEASGE